MTAQAVEHERGGEQPDAVVDARLTRQNHDQFERARQVAQDALKSGKLNLGDSDQDPQVWMALLTLANELHMSPAEWVEQAILQIADIRAQGRKANQENVQWMVTEVIPGLIAEANRWFGRGDTVAVRGGDPLSRKLEGVWRGMNRELEQREEAERQASDARVVDMAAALVERQEARPAADASRDAAIVQEHPDADIPADWKIDMKNEEYWTAVGQRLTADQELASERDTIERIIAKIHAGIRRNQADAILATLVGQLNIAIARGRGRQPRRYDPTGAGEREGAGVHHVGDTEGGSVDEDPTRMFPFSRDMQVQLAGDAPTHSSVNPNILVTRITGAEKVTEDLTDVERERGSDRALSNLLGDGDRVRALVRDGKPYDQALYQLTINFGALRPEAPGLETYTQQEMLRLAEALEQTLADIETAIGTPAPGSYQETALPFMRDVLNAVRAEAPRRQQKAA